MKRSIAVVSASLLLAFQLQAQTVTLRIASQAPENTPVGAGLAKLAAEYKRVSNGKVVLKVFHNGSQGDEDGMRQKMNTGLLDGALFDSFGLSHISPETMALCAPAVIGDKSELDYVLQRAEPVIRKHIEDKGFHVGALTMVGWVHFFSRYPIKTPTDLRKYKIAVNPYEKELIQLYKLAGLSIVMSPLTTMLQQLQTRSVDVFYTTPTYLSYQWSTYASVASHMTDVKVCPVIGGIVFRKQSWEKVPAECREAIEAANAAAGLEIGAEFLKKEATVVTDLQQYGLVLVQTSDEDKILWRNDFAKAVEKGTGSVFTQEMMDLINSSLAEYRNGKK
jgi:TRAP-type C4-dicarboxylate transport system substrate-binding protein